jgi:hypothetical protein
MEMDHSQHSQGTLSAKQALGETDIASQKASEIFEACKWRDTTRLRLLAESPGGFLADECRRVACKVVFSYLYHAHRFLLHNQLVHTIPWPSGSIRLMFADLFI